MTSTKFKRDTPLQAGEVALIIIDMQTFCALPGKGLHSHVDEKNITLEYEYFFSRLSQTTIPAIKSLLQTFRKEQRLDKANIIHTHIECLTRNCRMLLSAFREYCYLHFEDVASRQLQSFSDQSLDYKLSGFSLPKGHPDAAIIDELKPEDDDLVISKTSCSVFNSTNIEYVLRNLGASQLVICGILSNQCVESAVRDAADRGFYVHVAEDAIATKNDIDHQQALKNMNGFARITDSCTLIDEISTWNC